MDTRPNALFDCLVSDLNQRLRTSTIGPLQRFNHRAGSWPDIRDREVACLCLADSLLKKYTSERTGDADKAALDKFLLCNSLCKDFASIDQNSISEIEAIAIGELKNVIYSFFCDPYDTFLLDCDDCISHGINTGPGSSVGVHGTSHYEKVASGPLTGTSKSLYSLYIREVQRCSLWKDAEAIRREHFGDFVETTSSRLSYVPKDSNISRTICTEPSLNMMFQKGVAALLEDRLISRFSIDLRTQSEFNRELARIGSITQGFGTIDLTSASDTISMNLVAELLPKRVFMRLKQFRTDKVTLPSGEVVPLHMVSSMGNAFTFPLQTIIFSSIVLAVYKTLGIKIQKSKPGCVGNFAVFGDDIVVLNKAYDLVTKILKRCGFLLNLAKSYNEGCFRESCGADFWRGYNVRGIYCTSLKTKHDVYSLINRLNVWSSNHAVLLPITIGFLRSLVHDLNFVPQWESDVAGIKVPLSYLLSSKSVKRKYQGAIVYKRYMPNPRRIDFTRVDQRPFRKTDRLISNPAGILLCAVRGYLRDGSLTPRLPRGEAMFYQKRLAVAPNWDYYDPCRSLLTPSGWQRWQSIFVEWNLNDSSISL